MIAIRISEDALQDLKDGFLFYEAQEPDWEIISLYA